MCLALPYKIKSVSGQKASVYCPAGGSETDDKSVSLELVPDLKTGDFILVQNNMAIKKIPDKEAMEIFKIIN